MRVLTVRQPWAWAIIHGGKNVENRTRNIAGSYRGPVAIHAGLQMDQDAWNHNEVVRLEGEIDATREEMSDAIFARWVALEEMAFGAIIGVADLVDVHHSSECFEPEPSVDGQVWCSPWAMDGQFHLELANPRPIEPIPAKGRLGLWRPDADLLARIEGAL